MIKMPCCPCKTPNHRDQSEFQHNQWEAEGRIQKENIWGLLIWGSWHQMPTAVLPKMPCCMEFSDRIHDRRLLRFNYVRGVQTQQKLKRPKREHAEMWLEGENKQTHPEEQIFWLEVYHHTGPIQRGELGSACLFGLIDPRWTGCPDWIVQAAWGKAEERARVI